ncbi:GNAT family N-acetyltransferase [Clostridium sp. LIBA-8841]|uniref:GNAT family N-acetyltransferase n=1 Tax=Clostridium sp. LIBA-8841 TaxID=2987530 RepID=UPI002AC385AD|nr:GNAT family N-acetyltransferase [Clostridium sp. LIBA-8841]MDZ5252714.1 GNAT family N-acetyltransferase [Clostridium sp. LIBA-8841]
MKNFSIVKLSELDEEYKREATGLFAEGFHKMFSFTKDREVLNELFFYSLDFSMIYITLEKDKVVGLLGSGTNEKRAVSLNKEVFKKLLGNGKGTIVYKQMKSIMEKPAVKGDSDLYIDYLVTDKKYRGKGIATALINFVCNDERIFEECYIEVLSKNINAKNLYEKIGFKEYKRVYNPITLLQGLGYLIEMKMKIHNRIKI